jgi:LAO/AO transport system kinase
MASNSDSHHGKADIGSTSPYVMEGVEAPPSVNPNLVRRNRPALPPVPLLLESVLKGDRAALSRAITLIESTRPADIAAAGELLDKALPHAGNSWRVGITGVPGVGKSTLIEELGLHILQADSASLAVLAIDPSSEGAHGSILGDKSRMPRLAAHERAFIRPSPTGGSLGGVAHQTRETMLLCEAAGCTAILVETVGVGQSETAVRAMVDCFVLLALAGAGDELQGIKRGVMEMADLVAVTKADGDNVNRAKMARHQVQNALHYFSASEDGWVPPVLLTSAVAKTGIAELWAEVEAYIGKMAEGGWFKARRENQAVAWMDDLLRRMILQRGMEGEGAVLRDRLEEQVRQGLITPRHAAEAFMERLR